KSALDNFIIKPISSKHFIPENFSYDIGSKLSVVGFPRGYTDPSTYTPSLKSAVASTSMKGNFNKQPLFLIDGNLKKGMSGSPVFTELIDDFRAVDGKEYKFTTGSQFRFIGIHSATAKKTIGKNLEPIYETKNDSIIISKWREVDIEDNLELHTCYYNTILINLTK
ncbi:MAG: hypothetical protein AB8G86_24060, partial [Saprospiraceae bacterium]